MLPPARERSAETDRSTDAHPGPYESLRHPWIRVVDNREDGEDNRGIEPPVVPTLDRAA